VPIKIHVVGGSVLVTAYGSPEIDRLWYTYANLNLANVGRRLVLGHW
jgi:hypothetical protein